MSTSLVLLSSLAYILFLFGIAFFANQQAERGKSLVNNPYVYALSLAVYCTAWTFYGSVGKAASGGGFSFLTIYIGPILTAPLWIFLVRKMLLISKSQRITSIADFISARYGKSASLGVLVTLIAVIGVIPYISLQLKAIDDSSTILSTQQDYLSTLLSSTSILSDKAFWIAIVLTIFIILFGTRHLDPNERHEGLVAAIAFESLLKLVAFLTVGLFVCFWIFNGIGDLFSKAAQRPEIAKLFAINSSDIDSWSWSWMILLSMSAILFLPRQFHVLIVENTKSEHINKAAWLFPLYLLLINIFVLPIACGGLFHFSGGGVEPDNFVLELPLAYGKNILALFVYLGGFSAASGMVIVSVIALSIMISNNVVIPLLVRSSLLGSRSQIDFSNQLINIRRVSILLIMLLAYAYYDQVRDTFSLVSIGLISFAAIAQFLPVMIGALYWKGATLKGALAGLIAGSLVWLFTLGVPSWIETANASSLIFEEGYFGLSFLRPYALFGMTGSDHIAHAAFWSLLFNGLTFTGVSLYTKASPAEMTQADLFVDIEKHLAQKNAFEVVKKRANFSDVEKILLRFLGPKQTRKIVNRFARKRNIPISNIQKVDADFINYAEKYLAGSIGAASARVVLESVVDAQPIALDEMLIVLDQTQEIVQYSKALEAKSKALEATTKKLRAANERLKELDQLKADFISTVTHELRTPLTAIKSLARIMADHNNLSPQKRQQYLQIIVDESERLARLINQVLDLEKSKSEKGTPQKQKIDLTALVQKTLSSMEELIRERNITLYTDLPDHPIFVLGAYDQLQQVILNLLSNAIKFCDSSAGKINLRLLALPQNTVQLQVEDNGMGIAPKDQSIIFEQFTQVNSKRTGKPSGSGLGLYISKQIVEQHGGKISLKSTPGKFTTFAVNFPTIKN